MKASQHQSIGTLTGCSQMALSVLTIQIKKRDKHLVTSPHCYSYSLASQPPELALYALLNSPEHYTFAFVGALISYSLTSHLPISMFYLLM